MANRVEYTGRRLATLRRQVRAYRAEHALTAAELAVLMGVSLRTVRYLERDGDGVSAATLKAWERVRSGVASLGDVPWSDQTSEIEEEV